LLFGPNGIL